MDEIGREDLLAYWKGIMLFLSNHGWIEPDEKAKLIEKLISDYDTNLTTYTKAIDALIEERDALIEDLEYYRSGGVVKEGFPTWEEAIGGITDSRFTLLPEMERVQEGARIMYDCLQQLLQSKADNKAYDERIDEMVEHYRRLEQLGDKGVVCPACGKRWDMTKFTACSCGATIRRVSKGEQADEVTAYPSDHEPEMVAKYESSERVDEELLDKIISAIIDPLDDYDVPEDERLSAQITQNIRKGIKQLLQSQRVVEK